VIDADCILLIVSALDDETLHSLFHLAGELQMDVLMEVHDEQEMRRALTTGARLIGINNRNLRTFDTSLETTLNMLDMVGEDHILVTESGIHTQDDVKLMRDNGVNAFLVGEAFMRADDPGVKLAELFFN
jgi:indole-3-glycerol phosphate synthase